MDITGKADSKYIESALSYNMMLLRLLDFSY